MASARRNAFLTCKFCDGYRCYFLTYFFFFSSWERKKKGVFLGCLYSYDFGRPHFPQNCNIQVNDHHNSRASYSFVTELIFNSYYQWNVNSYRFSFVFLFFRKKKNDSHETYRLLTQLIKKSHRRNVFDFNRLRHFSFPLIKETSDWIMGFR